jgi:hypothetical protein
MTAFQLSWNNGNSIIARSRYVNLVYRSSGYSSATQLNSIDNGDFDNFYISHNNGTMAMGSSKSHSCN